MSSVQLATRLAVEVDRNQRDAEYRGHESPASARSGEYMQNCAHYEWIDKTELVTSGLT